MPTLILFRHAKSSWDDPDLEDHDRPLGRRGTREAPLIASWIAAHAPAPDLVLCSTAVRTRGTLALTLPAFATPPGRILHEHGLYLATPEALIERVQTIEPEIGCALVVGHNPGLHAAALSLVGRGKKRLLAQLATKFPTAAVAVLELASWADAAPGQAELTGFMTPKLLG